MLHFWFSLFTGRRGKFEFSYYNSEFEIIKIYLKFGVKSLIPKKKQERKKNTPFDLRQTLGNDKKKKERIPKGNCEVNSIETQMV